MTTLFGAHGAFVGWISNPLVSISINVHISSARDASSASSHLSNSFSSSHCLEHHPTQLSSPNGRPKNLSLFPLRYTTSFELTTLANPSHIELKNTTDDALPNYLTSLKFQQSHLLADVRLALGYSAVLIAGATFYADYKLGWDATKYWTFWAVVAYFILNGALTYWVWGVEKGKIFTGEIGDTLVRLSLQTLAGTSCQSK